MIFPETKGGIIYLTRNLINGKLYVGMHTRGRANYLGSGYALKSAIKKHGRENFIRTTIDTFSSPGEGFAKEIFWIKANDSKYPKGYNLTDGGDGVFNPTEEVRAKQRERNRGNAWGRFNKGIPKSDVHKAKLSARLLGKSLSDIHRANISLSLLGNTRAAGRFGPRPEMRGRMPWNKGTVNPAHSARMMGNAFSRGRPSPMLGRHHTDATKAKMKIARLAYCAKHKARLAENQYHLEGDVT